MTVEQAIERLKMISNQQSVIAIDWFEECDIQNIADNEFDAELTHHELLRVADDLENGDANVGMNWESIRFAVESIVSTRENKKGD